jgi:hypothetical protein
MGRSSGKAVGRVSLSAVSDLLSQISRHRPPKFSGLGVIFYRRPIRLPIHALGSQGSFRPLLPIQGAAEIAKVLRSVSSADSPWHDGFHLVDARSLTLTHVSQFISPSKSSLTNSQIGKTPIGARQLAAIAVSKYRSADCVALVSANGDMQLYRDGKMLKG